MKYNVTIQKQLLTQILHIVLTYLSEGLSTAKLFLGMARNDIRANSKGG